MCESIRGCIFVCLPCWQSLGNQDNTWWLQRRCTSHIPPWCSTLQRPAARWKDQTGKTWSGHPVKHNMEPMSKQGHESYRMREEHRWRQSVSSYCKPQEQILFMHPCFVAALKNMQQYDTIFIHIIKVVMLMYSSTHILMCFPTTILFDSVRPLLPCSAFITSGKMIFPLVMNIQNQTRWLIHYQGDVPESTTGKTATWFSDTVFNVGYQMCRQRFLSKHFSSKTEE